MRLILNAHPRVGIPGETNFFRAIYERYAAAGAWQEAVSAFLRICEERLNPPVELGEVRARLLAMPRPDYTALLEMPLAHWAASEGKPRWGEKTPEHIFYSEPIARLFPRARFVEMIRDPRAVVASMTRSSFKGGDATRNAFYWRYVMTTGHAALTRAVGPDRRLVVRYEDLVTEPERTVRSVSAFIGEDFDPAMLRFHEHAGTYLTPTRLAGDPRLSSSVRGDLDGWRQLLRPRQIAITEAVCAREMDALGYLRNARGLTLAGELETACKRAYVAWKHYQQRGRYYHALTGPVAGRLRQ
jgi:Sulfotransferase family